MLKKTLAVFAISLCMCSATLAQSAAKRIWCVGDSITWGTCRDADGDQQYDPRPTYRYDLYNKMNAAGWDFDYVGTQTGHGSGVNNGDIYASFPTWLDQDHDGWSGMTSQQVLNGHTTGQGAFIGVDDAAAVINPDIVLLHIGTNDQYQGMTLQQSQAAIGGIINAVQAANANAEIFVAAIIPTAAGNPLHNDIDTLSGWIANNIESYSTASSPVFMVDMHTGYNNVDWYADIDALGNNDGVHPDSLGEAFLADRWFTSLQANSSIPEPMTLSLLAAGGLLILRRRL